MKTNTTSNIIKGSLWMMFQTISLKAISFISQIILAWLLVPEVFGKVALMTAVTNITFISQLFGIQDVLIKRGNSFKLWFKTARTLMFIISIIAVVLSVCFAFLTGIIYKDFEITYLILILSLSLPFQSLSLIPDSKLKIDLRFDVISKVKVIEFLSIQIGILVLALFGFGIYSFVFPVVLIAVLKCIWLYKFVELKFSFKIYLKQWKFLFLNSLYGFYFALTSRISFQIDYIILGLFASKLVVGVYFMAFTLSVQAVGLLVSSLPTVIFPSLVSKRITQHEIGDKIFKINVLLAIFGSALSLWQCFNAEFLIKLVLDEKWYATIPLVQILSIGMFFRIIASQWVVPLKVNGDFKKLAIISFYALIVFVIILIPACYYKGELGLAYGVTSYYFIIAGYLIIKGYKGIGIDFKVLLYKCMLPFFLGILSFGLVYLLSNQFTFKESILNLILNLVLNTVISVSLYIVFIKVFMAKEYKLIMDKLKSILKK